jgi:purine-binding chemotaxis protein CheW
MEQISSSSSRGWCLFASGGHPYAVDLAVVLEVVDVEDLIPVPIAPPEVIGLCTVRRDVVPVVDPFGPNSTRPSESASGLVVLVMRTEQGVWGWHIDRDGAAVTETASAVDGSIARGDRLHAVVDAESTWRVVRERVEEWYSAAAVA